MALKVAGVGVGLWGRGECAVAVVCPDLAVATSQGDTRNLKHCLGLDVL